MFDKVNHSVKNLNARSPTDLHKHFTQTLLHKFYTNMLCMIEGNDVKKKTSLDKKV